VKNGILLIWLLLASIGVQAQKVFFVRVCNGGNNNNLSWRLEADTCPIFGTLKLFAKDADALPFFALDSGIIAATKTYSHVNANVPSTKDWSYYFQYQIICGSDTFTVQSNTLKIDDQKPDSTVLDSVSVDPLTNTVMLGWTSNKTPDFSAYYLYNYDRADPRLIENYKDTFYIDLTPINPKGKSLSYDITSSDSCDNRKEYGNYQHKTIRLVASIDTCVNRISLSWNAYVGWPVRTYELYRRINAGAFVLVDSFPGTTLSYSEIVNQINVGVEYFIRARKLGWPISSSSSNLTNSVFTGFSINPTNTQILYVSNNLNDRIELKIQRNPIAHYSKVDLYKETVTGIVLFIYGFPNSQDTYEDFVAPNTAVHRYFVVGKNMCDIATDTSKSSYNIVLNQNDNTANVLLNWNRYFTWNSGVKEYIMHRASGNTVQEATNFVAIKTLPSDTFTFDPKGSLAVQCYYVEAQENLGANKSKSNTVCYVKTGNIYYPNALVPNGTNTFFNFTGEGLDLSKSSMQVYNRWGQLEFNTENLISGWQGKNNAGEDVPGDVYFFTAQLYQGNELVLVKGNVTVLR
jgi:gliding motility-associated-like protein